MSLRNIVQRCQMVSAAIRPHAGNLSDISENTRAEYVRLASLLITRARYAEHGLAEVVSNTTSSRTYFKRIAALRYFLHLQHQQLVRDAYDGQSSALHSQLQEHLDQLQTFVALRQDGFGGARRKRSSKRLALIGLPDDWRSQLCRRGARGRYANALRVLALSGCRPSELANGVLVWREWEEGVGALILHIGINGTKVKAAQGQPYRSISYLADDPHPLVAALNRQLNAEEEAYLHISVASARNLSVEIRRLALGLWPGHKHAITAYCFRHQWSADMKSLIDGDAVSRGLGHVSAKTRRLYGVASQVRQGGLKPIGVIADRLVRSGSGPVFTLAAVNVGDDPLHRC